MQYAHAMAGLPRKSRHDVTVSGVVAAPANHRDPLNPRPPLRQCAQARCSRPIHQFKTRDPRDGDRGVIERPHTGLIE